MCWHCALAWVPQQARMQNWFQDMKLVLKRAMTSSEVVSAEKEVIVARAPYSPLSKLVRLPLMTRHDGRVNDTADRVHQVIFTVRVHLSTRVALWDTDVGEVAGARDLDVVLCLDKVHTRQSALGNQPSAVGRFGAVGYGYALEAAYFDAGDGWAPW